ncbi:putative NADH:ubiquinone oxidoreductase, subunit 1/F420H2 oxidoreductase subunit H [Helianthus anomalus]
MNSIVLYTNWFGIKQSFLLLLFVFLSLLTPRLRYAHIMYICVGHRGAKVKVH